MPGDIQAYYKKLGAMEFLSISGIVEIYEVQKIVRSKNTI